MSKINIVYWSGTGNTEIMAQNIAKGAKEAGASVELYDVSDISVDKIADETLFALGCAAMGNEELEESYMEPFMADMEKNLAGKKIVLFGSYGWGDGEWMRNWEERITSNNGELINNSIICNGEPTADEVESCINLGKEMAKLA